MSLAALQQYQMQLLHWEAQNMKRLSMSGQNEGTGSEAGLSQSTSTGSSGSKTPLTGCGVCPSVKNEQQKFHGEAIVFDITLFEDHQYGLCERCSCARDTWKCLSKNTPLYFPTWRAIRDHLPRTELLWFKSGALWVRPGSPDENWWDVISVGASGMMIHSGYTRALGQLHKSTC